MITHDHRGRPLTPAMSELLNTTIIPFPKARSSRKMSKSSDGQQRLRIPKPRSIQSVGSSCSLSSSNSTSLSNGPITPPNAANELTADQVVLVEQEDEDDDDERLLSRRRIRSSYPSSLSTSSGDNSDDEDDDDDDDDDDDASSDRNDEQVRTTDFEDEFFNWSWIDDFRNNNQNSTWGEDYEWSSDYSSTTSRRRRTVSARRKLELPLEECSTEHPLSAFEDDGDDDVNGNENENEKDNEEETSTAKSFVNNLTASLRAVASTFSSQERFYSTQLFAFSPRSTDEPIPSRVGGFTRGSIHMHEPASPLPPTTPASTPTHHTQTQPQARPPRKKSINLKTYAVETTLIPHLRPREIRMNSAFYRIYAVETLMRKNGKLNTDFHGRATMILEPRGDSGVVKEEDEEEMFGIRKRFEDSRRNDCRWSVICASDLPDNE